MSREITIDNYEAWLLDRAEGKLSAEEITVLEAFLQKNPHLQIEEFPLEEVQLKPVSAEFSNKEKLKKAFISEENETALIDLLESNISVEKKKNLFSAIKSDKALAQAWKLYQHTILKAPQHIHFTDKHLLKREAKVFRLRSIIPYAAAASLVVIIGAYWVLRDTEKFPLPVSVPYTAAPIEKKSPLITPSKIPDVKVQEQMAIAPVKNVKPEVSKDAVLEITSKRGDIILFAQHEVRIETNSEIEANPVAFTAPELPEEKEKPLLVEVFNERIESLQSTVEKIDLKKRPRTLGGWAALGINSIAQLSGAPVSYKVKEEDGQVTKRSIALGKYEASW